MKATIELPDGLVRRAKDMARQEGLPLRELIEASLRPELDRRAAPRVAVEFRLRTVGGTGLRSGVQPAQLRDLAYES